MYSIRGGPSAWLEPMMSNRYIRETPARCHKCGMREGGRSLKVDSKLKAGFGFVHVNVTASYSTWYVEYVNRTRWVVSTPSSMNGYELASGLSGAGGGAGFATVGDGRLSRIRVQSR